MIHFHTFATTQSIALSLRKSRNKQAHTSTLANALFTYCKWTLDLRKIIRRIKIFCRQIILRIRRIIFREKPHKISTPAARRIVADVTTEKPLRRSTICRSEPSIINSAPPPFISPPRPRLNDPSKKTAPNTRCNKLFN